MAPSKQGLHVLLLLLICSFSTDAAAKINSTTAPCLPYQASSLLQLKSSFIVANNLSSWQAGTDCCHWEGIICDTGSGRIISLDLSEFELMSLRLHPALFNLTSLRILSLAFNYFTDVRLPASGFERLTDITHLNFSYCDFTGQVPIGISRLKNLVTLDFSNNVGLYFQEPSFGTFLANMSNLRELHLDYVDLSGSGSTWSAVLGHSVPQLRILSLPGCSLSGSIHPSFSRLGALTTINFRSNYGLFFQESSFRTFLANMSNLRELHLDYVDLSSSGSTWSTALADSVCQLQILSLAGCDLSGSIYPSFSRLRLLASINLGYNPGLRGKVPEYFSQLSSLRSLDISYTSFEGQFPTMIFQLKRLSMLDLSGNPKLFVRLTYVLAGNNLQNLNLARTNFTYDTVLSFANLTSLQTLSLTTATMAKELPTSIRLPSLNRLELEGSGFDKTVLSWVGNLKELKYLQLDGYDLSQSVPTWIGNLTRLEHLWLWHCDISVPIPHQIGYLTTLTDLEFMQCDVYGQQIPSWIGNLTKLSDLILINCNFSGPIPSTIGNLTQLELLQFSDNSLTGNIPKSLFALPALQVVSLDGGNQLSGFLEDIPAPSSSLLTDIDLSGNQLTGPIPKSFFQLANLQYLNLESNKLMGTIELTSIWGLKSLDTLSLSNNMISLKDKEGDTVFLSLPNITYIALASCNLTKLPAAFRYINTVENLDLSSNQMQGAIPSWVWENWKYQLQSLDLSHNMFTTLEKSPSFVHMPSLASLDLSSNRLQGRIPIPVSSSDVVTLDYSNNNFSSIMPNFDRYLTNSTYINFSNNKLSGHIPPSLCSFNNLDVMDLSYNYFSGLVPSCLIERGSLTVLKLRENKLHGVFPENIREGCKIQTLDLSGNQIEGTLPKSLKNCQDLELLDVGSNRIVGSFPYWMGALPNLRVLILRSNKLNGTIVDLHPGHTSKNHFTSLQILDLSSNNLSGYLHSEWFKTFKSMMNHSNDKGQILEHYTNISNIGIYQDTVTITYKNFEIVITKILTTFKVIDFSDNSFEGPLPLSIGKLVSLHGLNLSHNNFVAQIPSQLGDLTRLESLDLSCNHFSGEIPQELASLTSLSWLNLSYNNLTGRIPEQNQFFSFPSSSFEGNSGLCGSQVSKQCDNPGSTTPRALDHQESNGLWQDRVDAILLFTFVGLGFGVGFALAILSRIFYRIEGWICKHFYIYMNM